LFLHPAQARGADPGTVYLARDIKFVTLETKTYTGTKQEEFLYIDGANPLYLQIVGPTVIRVKLRRAFHPDFPETLKPTTLTVFEGQQVVEKQKLPTRQDRASRFLETELLVPSEEVVFTLSPPLGVTTYAIGVPKKSAGGAVLSIGRKLGKAPISNADIFRGAKQIAAEPPPAAPERPEPKAEQAVPRPAPVVSQPVRTATRESAATTRWFKLVEMGVGLNVNYLLSFGPGDRYLSAPTFLLEGIVRLPSNESFFIPGARNTVAVGLEGGYYFSGSSEMRRDDIRGEYEVEWTVQVIPLYLNVYYSIPFSRGFSLTAGTGIGVSFVSLDPEYHTEFTPDEIGTLNEQPLGLQVIAAGSYRTGSVGEVRVEVRYSQVNFSSEFEESEGDLSGASFGLGYYFLFQ